MLEGELMFGCSFFFFSSRRRHTRFDCDWSSDVCSSDLLRHAGLVWGALLVAIAVALFPSTDFRRTVDPGDWRRGPDVWAASRALATVPSGVDRKSTRLNSSHSQISYAVFCLKKKTKHAK